MTKKRWEQIAAAGGIAFVVLQLASQGLIQIGGAEPPFTAPAEEIVDFFNNRNLGLAGVGEYLATLSIIALIFFLGALWASLSRAESEPKWMSLIAVGSGLAATAVTLGGGGWALAVFRLEDGLSPDMARLLFDQGNYTFAQLWVPLSVMTLVVGILALREGAFSKVFGWYSIVVALLLLISRAFWAAPGGVAFTGYMLFWLWLIIASVVLIRRA
ncbi:MAG: hypothetical protein ACK2T3_14165 [Candidatus Promineifilaceae bacterium]|jgi:hypothetical protein